MRISFDGFITDGAMHCTECLDTGKVMACYVATDAARRRGNGSGIWHRTTLAQSFVDGGLNEHRGWTSRAIAFGHIQAFADADGYNQISTIWSWESRCGDICDECMEPITEPCGDSDCEYCGEVMAR